MSNVENEDVKPGNGQAPTEGEAAAAAPQAGETVEQKLEKAERERAEAHDRMLRVAADFENYKRRVRREVDDAEARTKERILREILPVLDNFERALVAVGKAGDQRSLESLEQGVRLVEKQLHGALEKAGVKGFDAKGQPFDPAKHEAIQQVETAAQPAGTVVDVFARGYMLGERLLRPAMVSVAKAPPAPAVEGDGAGKSE